MNKDKSIIIDADNDIMSKVFGAFDANVKKIEKKYGVSIVIRDGKTHQLDTIIQTGADQGMQTMDRTLVKLIQTGVITYDNAREFAVDLQEFERLARG